MIRQATAARNTRRMRLDRAAGWLIALGGVGVIAAVVGMLVFIAGEAVPLFRSAVIRPAATVALRPAPAGLDGAAHRALGVDEYQRYLYVIEPDGLVVFYALASGDRVRAIPVPGIAGATVTASAASVSGHLLAAGLSDGRVTLLQVRFTPRYDGTTLVDLDVEVRDRGTARLDPARAVRQVSAHEQDGRRFVAAILDGGAVRLWWTDDAGREQQADLAPDPPHRFTHARVGRNGAVIAGTGDGLVYRWDHAPDLRRTGVARVSATPISALEWMLGGNSFVAGADDGTISGWFERPSQAASESDALVRAHAYPPQTAPVEAIVLSSRDRSFATVGRDGGLVLRHMTSGRTLGDVAPEAPMVAALITPKADGLLAIAPGGHLRRFALDNPHPEISWAAMFGKIWYEGYAEPAYVWQSTAATDDFEPKFSLVPLIFGTIKGTVYAMLFAVPLALLGALYTSQFMDGVWRARIKPTVEIMAAVPSVVIGFVAGLYLAPVVERHLVGVVLMFVLMPALGTAGAWIWPWLPARMTVGRRPGAEIALIVALLLAAAWLGIAVGPAVERWLFDADARLWLQSALGLSYDQRNCLVVGLAMGLAVIPLIFTISEDAFSSVPSSLTAASLALGATPWQTATRVVLPTASPGVFSAIMIGFGRAVGETMIVLMATGNTPVMDWSIFNGIRTLSANIVVEIPEAPYGGTLYRTLFLSAGLLFVMTFLVNTVAEVVRQRLRDRYRAA
jgi:phosphate transport system permease protein